METGSLATPVLLVIFNRPSTTRRVFEAIRAAKPSKLYIAADGPREGKPGEAEKCEACRQVVQRIDWDCQVNTLFRDKNLGCGEGPSQAITWFFSHEEEGIILEDDCLPSASFFTFCAQMLARYRNDTRIVEIAGNNLQKPHRRDREYSYGFSNLVYSWGWATWRRAWALHDFRMRHFTEISAKGYLDALYGNIYERQFYAYIFYRMYEGDHITNRKNIWDYQWQFACKIHSSLVIVPNRNLVRNLGHGEDATNTTDPKGFGHDLKLEEMEFPLKHPEFVMVNTQRDRQIFKTMHTSHLSRLKSIVKMVLPSLLVKKLLLPLRNFFQLAKKPSLSRHFWNPKTEPHV
jgi:hypothetical protein